MLDRQVVKEFLEEELEGVEISVEDDYYEWLKDNFKSFFEFRDGELDWNWIRGKLKI